MSDYKYEMQMMAEDIALDDYGVEFYRLDSKGQERVYNLAMQEWHDKMASRAESLRDE